MPNSHFFNSSNTNIISMDRKLLLLFITLFIFSLVFCNANLNIQSIDYSDIYINSDSTITYWLNNTGDEDAVITGSELYGFSNWVVKSSPSIISPDSSARVSYSVSTPCKSPGSVVSFYSNFSYNDSQNIRVLESESSDARILSSINTTLVEPDSLDDRMGINVNSFAELSYNVLNTGSEPLSISFSIIQPYSIFSRTNTRGGVYNRNDLESEYFVLDPNENLYISHSLIPTQSGRSDIFAVTVEDAECSYNSHTFSLRYTTISSTNGFFNIIIADEADFYILIGVLLLCFLIYSHR